MPRLRHLGSALLAALVVSAVAQAGGTHDFDKIVVFGDSLSDNGNLSLALGQAQPSRFTTNPGEVAIEHVADYYGLGLTPAITGGTDFAFGGAGVVHNAPGIPPSVPTITAQVDGYLAGANSLDSRTLYSMWGGANDIFYHATAAGAAGQAQQLIQQTIQAQVAQALANGLPQSQVDAFIAQITPTVTQQVASQVAAAAGVGALETPEQAQAAVGAAAQQELKLLGQMHGAGAKYVVVFNLPDIGLTPSAAAQGPAGVQALSGLSMIYNGVLDGGLNTLSDQGLNIVPVNVYGLFNEVIADPAAFGFTNVTVPACLTGSDTHTAGLTSVQCGPEGSGAPYTYAPGTENTYLFADGVHPTTAAHKMLAQYVIAELTAPGQASMLAEVPLATGNAHVRLLRKQERIDQAGGATRVFLGLNYGRQRFDATSQSPKTDSNDVNLALGVDAAASEHFNVGVALGLARSNADIGGGGFRLDSMIGSGYALWHDGGAYVGAHVGFTKLSYKDINRRFQLGALTRTETGETDGSQILAGLDGGWWSSYGNWRTGPFARLEWQRIRVDGYSEDGDDSSAMWFAGQQRTAMVGTLGWQLRGDWKVGNHAWHPYLNIAWHRDGRADARTVRAGLTGMQGSFALTGFIPDANWTSADLGLQANLSDSISTWFAYHGRFGDSNQRLDSLNMGFKIAF